MNCKITLCAALCLVAAALAAPTAEAEETYRQVTTGAGQLEGVKDKDSGIYLFLGIPYAQPPVGSLRFQPPQAAASWNGTVKSARYFAPACPQLEEQHQMSEDCLALNVWTPTLAPEDGKPLPVMVFIHGGGFVEGTTASSLYDGTSFAERGIVYVSIQYRLGMLGWFDLSGMGSQYENSANNGLKDQLLALQWVQDNIATFGGDKDRVTVMGHAAGSISISAMLSLPEPERLFKRAILMSGGPHWVHTKRQSFEISEWIVRLARTIYTEGDTIDYQLLVDSTAKDLVELQSVAEYYSGVLDQQLFAPTVDGHFITTDPMEAVDMGSARNIEVLIGSTRDEINMWLDMLTATTESNFAFYPWPLPLDEPNLSQAPVDMSVDGVLKQVIADEWFAEYCPNCDSAMKVLFYFSHLIVHNDVLDLAAAQAKWNPKTFVYRFNWVSPDHYDWGSPQGLDLGFVFDALHETTHVTGEVNVPKHMLADTMQALWTEFVYEGDLSKLGAKPEQFWFDWPAFSASNPKVLEINDLSHGRIQTREMRPSPFPCEDEENRIAQVLPNLCRKNLDWANVDLVLVALNSTDGSESGSLASNGALASLGVRKKHNKQHTREAPEPFKLQKRSAKKTGLQYLTDMVFGDMSQEL